MTTKPSRLKAALGAGQRQIRLGDVVRGVRFVNGEPRIQNAA